MATPKILLLGSGGQLGLQLGGLLSALGSLTAWGRGDFQISSSCLSESLDRLKPAVIVNAAAYTKVDAAESQPLEARLVNAVLPEILAHWAKKNSALLVHYSTDYVFDGQNKAPYLETDSPNPLNVYGRTKLEGEKVISEIAPRHLIFRTSWVFSVFGANFPKTILVLAAVRDTLVIKDDQIGAPTSAELIASVTALAVRAHLTTPDSPQGLYHLTASGAVTWYQYAQELMVRARRLGWPLPDGRPRLVPSYGPDPAKAALRPLNSQLNTNKLLADWSVVLPDWTWYLDRFVFFLLNLKKFSL
ncbi:MAG: dTDP-4-dehydrorhamnose reductase [Deltaproteobacteria bacterium]|jgi:dTDP-4-dehydrorhamnose reductase|nr:dTDP-4-dehydrorhamnose reductase [Deltaproteobacteria bacterium]